MNTASRHLLLHGTIVLLIGLLAGIPYGSAIAAGAEEPIRAWELAHGSSPLGATTMIAVAGILSHLAARPRLRWGVVVPFVVSGYGSSVALPLVALTGVRGLSLSGPFWNRVVFTGNSVGALGSLMGTVFLLYAVSRSLRRPVRRDAVPPFDPRS